MNTTNTRLKIRPHFLLMFVIICTSISAVFSQQTISSNCASPKRMDVHVRGILNQGNKNITLGNGTNRVTMECVCRDMIDDGIERCPNSIEFTVRKLNGTTQNISVLRETVNIDDDDRFPSRIYRATYTGATNRVTYNAPPAASRPSMRGLVVWQESVGNGTPNVPNNYEVDRFFYDTQVSPLPFYDIDVPESSTGNSRDFVVYIPVHEHGDNGRPIEYQVRAYDGNIQRAIKNETVTADDVAPEVRLDSINLNNVPGNVDRIRVQIWSPEINHPFYGASVVVGSIMVTSDPCCTSTLNCPSNITRSADVESCDYTVQGGELNATWAGTCPVTLTNNYNGSSTLAGATFPVGTTTITWTAGSATCQTTITVNDPTGTGICEYVWPGDFNYDGIVTERDILYLGRAYNFSGLPRPAAASDWSGQVANLWVDSIDDVNSMHQDGNGDGIVDESDIEVLNQNFGLEHDSFLSPLPLTSTLRYELVPQDTVSGRYDLYITDIVKNNISTHGISLVIDFGDIVITEASIDTIGSSLQPDIIFQRYDALENKLYVTLTRTDGIDRLCNGPVASLVVIADNVASKTIHLRDGVGMQADGTVQNITNMSMRSTVLGFVSLNRIGIETEDINIEVSAHHAECGVLGSAEVSAYDGTPPYTYAWCTGANTPEITGLPHDSYQVTVTDANNNTKDLSFDIENILVDNCNTISPNIHVLLGGAYDMDSDTMSTRLQQMGILSIHPYTEVPWNYISNWTSDSYPDHSVDWVLVSFCNDATRSTQIAQVAAILKKDGSLYFPDEGVRFASSTGSVYVIIEHRNHIAVMTPQPIPIIGNALTYDFSSSDSYCIPTSAGQKQVSDEKWAMYAGDCAQIEDMGYDINGSDKILWDTLNGSWGGCFSPDFNLDGEVNGEDKWLWEDNNGIHSSVPK